MTESVSASLIEHSLICPMGNCQRNVSRRIQLHVGCPYQIFGHQETKHLGNRPLSIETLVLVVNSYVYNFVQIIDFESHFWICQSRISDKFIKGFAKICSNVRYVLKGSSFKIRWNLKYSEKGLQCGRIGCFLVL